MIRVMIVLAVLSGALALFAVAPDSRPSGNDVPIATVEDPAEPQDLPDGVTPAMIERGGDVFRGSGMCYNCHGQGGQGVPGVGADLTDTRWVASDGSYPDLVRVVRSGVPASRSESGVPMPPRGGTRISDADLAAAAAFVWSLRLGSP